MYPDVVPRKGDVDRNMASPSDAGPMSVVPRKGDVDRNFLFLRRTQDEIEGRPPQGGRG